MAVNVGASVFNNWRNNKQSHKLQEKQQEFARAAAERNKQRMWQLMREGQELALEMEHETHENRLEDIRNDFDRILHRLAYKEAINNWPLKVLPIVMKNQSLGSLTATANEKIAMHCILTPSNCVQFNKHILPVIEEKLADFCNLHWSTLSSHPILFYSGAWRTGSIPTGIEVSQLQTNLSNLPTLLITPFFKPEGGIVFQLNAWGIGVELETEIECTDFSYTESYKCGIDYQVEDDIKESTIEEFAPYLQCLIGYIADQYFWTSHNESPLLPTLLAMNVVNTDGMQYLNTSSEERYSNLLDVCVEESQSMPFSPDKMLCLLEGNAALWNENIRKERLEEIFITNVQCRCDDKISSMKEALSCEFYSKEDLPFLRKFIELYQYNDYKDELSNLIAILESIDFDYSILESTDIAYLEGLADDGNPAAMFRLGEIYEYSIGVSYNITIANQYYNVAYGKNFILTVYDIHNFQDYQALCNLVGQGVSQAMIIFCKYAMETNNMEYVERILNIMNADENPSTYYYAQLLLLANNVNDYKKYIKESAEQGCVYAQVELSEKYVEGVVLRENPQLHYKYAEMAMLQNSPKGTFDVFSCLLKGYGVQKSPKAAILMLDRAVELGYPEAIKVKDLSKIL